MKPADLHDVAELYHMLADPTRAALVALLAKGPKAVTALAKELRLPRPKVTHHLALLRNQHLLDGKRKSRQVFYSLNRGKLEPAKAFLAKVK